MELATLPAETRSLPLQAEALFTQAGRVFDRLDVTEETRLDYKARIGHYINFISRRGMNFDAFLDYKRELAGRTDLAVSSKNKYLAVARIFTKELHRVGAIPADITGTVKSFQQSKKHRKDGVNDDEAHRIQQALLQMPDCPATDRARAIIALMMFQGLRQIEISRLNVQDIDFISKTALVQGKGCSDKEAVHLNPDTIKALKTYLKAFRRADGPLFCSISNNKGSQRLTTRGIRGIADAVFNTAGVEKTAHGLRHYFATELVKAYDGDVLTVMRYTRHKSVDMLQVYNDAVLQEADLPRFFNVFSGLGFC